MAWVWTGMVLLSLIFGIATGNLDEVANAALEGAGSAVELSISMAGHSVSLERGDGNHERLRAVRRTGASFPAPFCAACCQKPVGMRRH